MEAGITGVPLDQSLPMEAGAIINNARGRSHGASGKDPAARFPTWSSSLGFRARHSSDSRAAGQQGSRDIHQLADILVRP